MADNKRRGRSAKGSEDAAQSIFDLFEPPPEQEASSFGRIPIIRDDDEDSLDLTNVEYVEAQAAAEAEAAGLQHWTEPASGQVPAALGSDTDERPGEVRGPSWRGDDPNWEGPDLSDVFADTEAITHERVIDRHDRHELSIDPMPTLPPPRRTVPQPKPSPTKQAAPSIFDEAPRIDTPRIDTPRIDTPRIDTPRRRNTGERPAPAARATPDAGSEIVRQSAGRSALQSERHLARESARANPPPPAPPTPSPAAPAPSSGHRSTAPPPSDRRPAAPVASDRRPASAPPAPAPSPDRRSASALSTDRRSAVSPRGDGPGGRPSATGDDRPGLGEGSPGALPGLRPEESGQRARGAHDATPDPTGPVAQVPRPPLPERRPVARPAVPPPDRSGLGSEQPTRREQLLQDRAAAAASEELEEFEEFDEPESGGRGLGQRVVVGIALAALVFVTLGLGPLPTMVLVGVLTLLAVMELFNAMRLAGLRPATLLGLVGAVALPAATYARGDAGYPLVVGLAVVFGMLWYLTGADTERPVLNLGLTLTGILWVGGLAGFAALMVRSEEGIGLLLATILITAASDTLAFLGGKAYGTKPFHSASPNKTWEGTLTGFFGALFAGLVLGVTDVISAFDGEFVNVMALAAVVGVLAPIGDLAESLVKRDLGIKDMGTLLPGHGGILDRVDGLLFALPGAYYVAVVFQLI